MTALRSPESTAPGGGELGVGVAVPAGHGGGPRQVEGPELAQHHGLEVALQQRLSAWARLTVCYDTIYSQCSPY